MPTTVACITCGRHPQKCACHPRRVPRACSVCDVLGCCPYYHRDDVLEVDDAVRAARVAATESTVYGDWAAMLARFILATHGGGR